MITSPVACLRPLARHLLPAGGLLRLDVLGVVQNLLAKNKLQHRLSRKVPTRAPLDGQQVFNFLPIPFEARVIGPFRLVCRSVGLIRGLKAVHIDLTLLSLLGFSKLVIQPLFCAHERQSRGLLIRCLFLHPRLVLLALRAKFLNFSF